MFHFRNNTAILKTSNDNLPLLLAADRSLNYRMLPINELRCQDWGIFK